MQRWAIGLAALTLLAGVAPAKGALFVWEDDFDDGVLGSEWTVAFNDTPGWSYVESGTTLQVSDIQKPSSPSGNWSVVSLTQPLSQSVGDFHVDFDISWTTGSAALQEVLIALRDTDGNLIAEAGYVDDILAVNGWADMRIGAGGWVSQAPVHWGAGEAIDFGIDRRGDQVGISVFNTNDGTDHLLLTGTSDSPLEVVEIYFGRGTDLISPLNKFYTEDVDLVRVAEVPEPSSFACWALLAVAGIASILRRRG